MEDCTSPTLFDEVAGVLGKEDAEKHLGLVAIDQNIDFKKTLPIAFTWALTPQGHEFWKAVDHALRDGQ